LPLFLSVKPPEWHEKHMLFGYLKLGMHHIPLEEEPTECCILKSVTCAGCMNPKEKFRHKKNSEVLSLEFESISKEKRRA